MDLMKIPIEDPEPCPTGEDSLVRLCHASKCFCVMLSCHSWYLGCVVCTFDSEPGNGSIWRACVLLTLWLGVFHTFEASS